MGEEIGSRKAINLGSVDREFRKIWTVIDPPGGSDGLMNWGQERNYEVERSPEELKNLVYDGATLWGSKIYFIGGQIDNFSERRDEFRRDEPVYSNSLFCFDTISENWEEDNILSPMGTPRAPQAVSAVQGKIYVFGFGVGYVEDPNIWGECYDISKNVWNYLKPPPPEWPSHNYLFSHAVYGGQIIFWFSGYHGICSYDTITDSWNLDVYYQLKDYPYWSRSVAVVDNCVYWHNVDSIYAFDFTTKQTRIVFDLKEKMDPYYVFNVYHEINTHLVHVGDGRFCLVWRDRFQSDHIHCYSFLIKGEGEAKALEYEDHLLCETPCFILTHLLLL